MIHIFANIYKTENFTEQTQSKICCKSISHYILQCPSCQKFICFNHAVVKVKPKSEEKMLVCFYCQYK
ncbi:MAG: hypothetical protein MRERV_25c018 [Mycoplasmataceae bacterium RV_VA103A]|nr:MAG: hypothetical protein MRERV_25c018 [Mycoplasmataceae bacterium RV_VA103A]